MCSLQVWLQLVLHYFIQMINTDRDLRFLNTQQICFATLFNQSYSSSKVADLGFCLDRTYLLNRLFPIFLFRLVTIILLSFISENHEPLFYGSRRCKAISRLERWFTFIGIPLEYLYLAAELATPGRRLLILHAVSLIYFPFELLTDYAAYWLGLML